jgi:protein-serine/threonine kinase
LGQTLGEGEFGKVKLGWRRDGGVQASRIPCPLLCCYVIVHSKCSWL